MFYIDFDLKERENDIVDHYVMEGFLVENFLTSSKSLKVYGGCRFFRGIFWCSFQHSKSVLTVTKY